MSMSYAAEIASDRPLSSIGYDPSTERGARMMSYRLRLKWLDKNIDVPCIFGISVSNWQPGNKACRDIYGVKLLWKQARKVTADEAKEIRVMVMREIEAWF